MEEKFSKLQAKLETDKGLAEKLFTLETPQEVQSTLKEEGLEFTLEEIDMLGNALVKSLSVAEDGELTDEALEDVAGGFVITAAVIGATASVIGATCGAGTFTHTVTRGRW
ncbi:MAG: Nif11-like leader peptide family RiPP precursor [Peptococcaceae bacterium]